jgi:type III secretion system IpaD/SipD/SspD family effector
MTTINTTHAPVTHRPLTTSITPAVSSAGASEPSAMEALLADASNRAAAASEYAEAVHARMRQVIDDASNSVTGSDEEETDTRLEKDLALLQTARLRLIDTGSQINQLRSGPGALDDVDDRMGSNTDLYDQVTDMIGDIQNDYLNKYRDALQKYLDFFRELSDILADISKHVNINYADPNFMHLKLGPILARLETLKADYSDGNAPLGEFDSAEDAQKFLDDLGGSGLSVVQHGDKYLVKVDIRPLTELIESIPPHGEMYDTARFQQWLNGKDSRKETYQNAVTIISEKYSRANAIYDNLVKLLSSLIESVTKTDESFLQF